MKNKKNYLESEKETLEKLKILRKRVNIDSHVNLTKFNQIALLTFSHAATCPKYQPCARH